MVKKCILYSENGASQGNPVAMAMYVLGLSVLQSEIKQEKKKLNSVAYADDYVGARSLHGLSKWWDNLTKRGQSYGSYSNAVKSLLIVKPDRENLARKLFNGTNVKKHQQVHANWLQQWVVRNSKTIMQK